MNYELKTKTELIAELHELRKRLEDFQEVRTAKAMAEDAVEELLETLALIVQGTPSGLFIYQYDAPDQLTLLNGNPEAAKLTGLKIEEWKGRGLTDEWTDTRGGSLKPSLLEAARTGRAFESSRVNFRGTDNRNIFKMSAFSLPQSRLAVSFEDMTPLELAESRLVEVRRQLDELSGKALENDKLIKELRADSGRKDQVIEELRETNGRLETAASEFSTRIMSLNEQITQEQLEMEQMEHSLQVYQNRYRMLVENSPVGIVSCDFNGHVTELNNEMLHIIGAPSADAARKINLFAFEPFIEAGITDALRNCMQSDQVFAGDFPYNSRSGAQIYARIRVGPIRTSDGKIVGAQAVMEDISESKRSEALLLRSERLKAVGEMAGGVAHSFNNWLQVATGAVQAAMSIVDAKNHSDVAPLLEQAMEGARQAALTVRRLQQFGKARGDSGASQNRIFDLSEAVREAIEMRKLCCRPSSELAAAPAQIATDLEAGCMILGEQDELIELVVNFLKNAVEASPAGAPVQVKTFMNNGEIVLEIHDTGLGVHEKDLDKIFEPFWTTKASHAGIGLTVNQGIAQRHGGTVAVDSAPEAGTRISVRFPLAKQSSPAPDPDIAEESTRNLSILLIDDHKPVVNILEKGLRKQGHTTYAALSGQDGLYLFEDNSVDVVVCDLGMENMTGWDVSRAIQAACIEKGIPKPPFIMLTGWAGQLAHAEISRHPDVDRIVEKPITIPQLVKVIQEEVKRSEVATNW